MITVGKLMMSRHEEEGEREGVMDEYDDDDEEEEDVERNRDG